MLIVKKKEITITNILSIIIVQQYLSKTKNNLEPGFPDQLPDQTFRTFKFLNNKFDRLYLFLWKCHGKSPNPFSPGVIIIPAVTVSSISRNWRDSNHGPPALWRHHHPQSPFGSFPNDIRTIWVIRNSSKTVSIHIKNIIWENIQKIILYKEIQKWEESLLHLADSFDRNIGCWRIAGGRKLFSRSHWEISDWSANELSEIFISSCCITVDSLVLS